MPIQQFTLIVEGPDLQAEPFIDELFGVGCDDATVGRVDGIQYIAFDRQAASLGQAVLSAVRDVEDVEGARVVGVAEVGRDSMGLAARQERGREPLGWLAVGDLGSGGTYSPSTGVGHRYRLGPCSDAARRLLPASQNDQPKVVPSLLRPTSARDFVSSTFSFARLAGSASER